MRYFLKGALVALLAALGTPVLAQTLVTLTPATGHPNLPVTVSGSGFADSEAVDIYIDTVDSLLAVSGATGSIKVSITMPAAAQPGLHYVTAIGRRSGDAAQAAFTVSTNWSEDGFGAAHLLWNQYENTLSPSVVPALELLWSAPESSLHGSPIVIGDKVYIASNTGGSGNGLYALNATTGALIWHQTTAAGEAFNASAAVAGGAVYVVGSTGIAYAFNAAKGTFMWSQQLASPGYSGPVVVDGVIYVASGISIYALSTTGSIMWSTATGAQIRADSLAVVNGRVFAASTDGYVYALNASTGAVIWTYFLQAAIYTTPAVANGIVYAAAVNGGIYALRAANGAYLWNANPGEGTEFDSSPAVAGGVVYISSTESNELYAFNAATGTSLWMATIPGGESQISIANGVVYAGDDTGNVTAFDAENGQYLLAVATGGSVYAAPVVTNGLLYVDSSDGNLYAFAPGGAGADSLRRSSTPPSPSSLHPDMRLVPVR